MRFEPSRATAFALVIVAALLAVRDSVSQETPSLRDRPLSASESDAARVAAAVDPFVRMGRASYPAAKARFIAGLPSQHRLYVVIDLRDFAGRTEQVFVSVDKIDGQSIDGNIASDVLVVAGYAAGDEIRISETSVRDWSIVAPDGTEEGNYVGRFIDHYRPGEMFVAVFEFSVSPAGAAQDVKVAMVTDETRDPLNVDLPPDWLQAASRRILDSDWSAKMLGEAAPGQKHFVPFVYDPDQPKVVGVIE